MQLELSKLLKELRVFLLQPLENFRRQQTLVETNFVRTFWRGCWIFRLNAVLAKTVKTLFFPSLVVASFVQKMSVPAFFIDCFAQLDFVVALL